MDPLLGWGAFLVAVSGVALVPRWLRRASRLATVARMPVRPIEGIRDGEWVRIEGRVEPLNGSFAAPLSGREAVWHRSAALVEQDFGFRLDDEERRDFVVRDATGRAVVRASDASTLVLDEKRFAAHTTDERVRAFFAQRGEVPMQVVPIECLETVVAVGATVSVVGLARHVPDPAGASTHREVASRLELVGSQRRPLIVR